MKSALLVWWLLAISASAFGAAVPEHDRAYAGAPSRDSSGHRQSGDNETSSTKAGAAASRVRTSPAGAKPVVPRRHFPATTPTVKHLQVNDLRPRPTVHHQGTRYRSTSALSQPPPSRGSTPSAVVAHGGVHDPLSRYVQKPALMPSVPHPILRPLASNSSIGGQASARAMHNAIIDGKQVPHRRF
jgi:hypothetical protein